MTENAARREQGGVSGSIRPGEEGRIAKAYFAAVASVVIFSVTSSLTIGA